MCKWGKISVVSVSPYELLNFPQISQFPLNVSLLPSKTNASIMLTQHVSYFTYSIPQENFTNPQGKWKRYEHLNTDLTFVFKTLSKSSLFSG